MNRCGDDKSFCKVFWVLGTGFLELLTLAYLENLICPRDVLSLEALPPERLWRRPRHPQNLGSASIPRPRCLPGGSSGPLRIEDGGRDGGVLLLVFLGSWGNADGSVGRRGCSGRG
jgi:hypothetical protein